MIEVDCQTTCGMEEQLGLEDKLKLPVVITKAGTIFVLDKEGRTANVYSAAGLSGKRTRPNISKIGTKTINDRKLRTRSPLKAPISPVKLIIRYPQVSTAAAGRALKQIGTLWGKHKIAQLIIDAGPESFDWARMRKYVFEIFKQQAKPKVRAIVTIEGNIPFPAREHRDFIGRGRIITRFVLGCGLGYKKQIDGAAARTLEAITEYGLRMPVLFYWSGESSSEVAEILRKALELNKLSGIGILPYFLSPVFEGRSKVPRAAIDGFTKVVEYLHNDRLLSEYLEEPVNDIEQRLTITPHTRFTQYMVTPNGGLLAFERLPFAATKKLKASICGACKRCAWRHICGGIDASREWIREQHKFAAGSWCIYRQVFMRKITGECLDIREQLQQYDGQLTEAAS